jgi:hypothetical protein
MEELSMMKKIILMAFLFALAGIFVTCELDTALRCTVKFENPAAEKGSKPIPDVLVQKGTSLGKKLPKLPPRQGVVLYGWYDGNTRYDADTIVTTDVTLTARWADDIAIVKFEFNQTNTSGQVITPTIEIADFNAIKGLPLGPLGFPVTPRSEGWKFESWLLDGEEFTTESVVPGDITLEAFWVKAVEYTVTFNTQGSIGTIAPMKVYANECIDEWRVRFPPQPVSTNAAAFFVAWLDKENREYDGRTPIRDDVTITTRWGLPPFKVILKMSDRSSGESSPGAKDGEKGHIKSLASSEWGVQGDNDYGPASGSYNPVVKEAWDSTPENPKWVIVNNTTYDVPNNPNRWRILYRIEFDWPTGFNTDFYTKYTIRGRFYANQQGAESWTGGGFKPNKPAESWGYKKEGWLTAAAYVPSTPTAPSESPSMADDGWGQISWTLKANWDGQGANAETLIQRYNLDRKGGTINDDWAPQRGTEAEKQRPAFMLVQTSDNYIGHIEIYEIVFHNARVFTADEIKANPALADEDEWQYTDYIDAVKPKADEED